MSAFSASALGRVLAGPDVRVNGETGLVTVALASEVEVTVSMNPGQDSGSPRDWWLVASTPAGLYYMNNSFAWAQAVRPYQNFIFPFGRVPPAFSETT